MYKWIKFLILKFKKLINMSKIPGIKKKEEQKFVE